MSARKARRQIERTAARTPQPRPAAPSLAVDPRAPAPLTAAQVLQLQRIQGNRQVSSALVQRFYLESDSPQGYVWVDNNQWDATKYEVSPKSKLLNGWVLRNLYRRKSDPPQPKVDPEPQEQRPPDPTPKLVLDNQQDVKQDDQKDVKHDDKKQEAPPEPVFDGMVIYQSQGFYVNDPKLGKLKLDAGSFKIAVDTPISYKIVQVNPYFTKAVVVAAKERPQSISVNVQIEQAMQQRTQAVQQGGFIDPQTLQIVGQLNSSGARKHYGDQDALATDDGQVRGLLQLHIGNNNYTVAPDSNTSDKFTISLGKNQQGAKMSIIGSITYTNSQKTTVQSVSVFHVGPSL